MGMGQVFSSFNAPFEGVFRSINGALLDIGG